MRIIPFATFALVLAAPASLWAAPPKTGPASLSKTEMAAAVDLLSQQIFAAADKNHNQVLNKNEFRTAQNMLQESMTNWARLGRIGQGKRLLKDKDAADSTESTASTVNKLAGSNKVSPAEFSFYTHTFVADADEHVRQVVAASEAQRKAQSQQRAMQKRRAAGRYPY